MAEQDIRGVKISGREPKALVLSDGTELSLEEEAGRRGRADWKRENGDGASELSVADALSLAGDEFAGYVTVRTRSEVAWLRVVAEWYQEQADRLARDLEQAGPTSSPRPA